MTKNRHIKIGGHSLNRFMREEFGMTPEKNKAWECDCNEHQHTEYNDFIAECSKGKHGNQRKILAECAEAWNRKKIREA